MKYPFVFSLPAVFAVVLSTAAFADPGTDALVAAAKAAEDAPAYRMNVTSTDPASGKPTVMTLEIVKPESIHMKSEAGGQIELITDGKRVFMSQGGGKLMEAPAQMGAVIKQARQQFSGEAVARMAHDVKLVGHEAVNGVPASVYTFNSDVMGLHSESKEWISDKDHRPLKLEGTTKGQLQAGGQTSPAMDAKSTATFEYDPTIKITLPAS